MPVIDSTYCARDDHSDRTAWPAGRGGRCGTGRSLLGRGRRERQPAVLRPAPSCDRTQDQYCLGTGFFSLLIGLVLVVLLGWGLLALFRVRRPLLVALAGPPIMFILAWLSSTVGVMVFQPSIVQVVAAFVAYALSALVLSRLA